MHPGREWTYKRLCNDRKCSHWECRRADQVAKGVWYDPERLRKNIFDPTLPFPHSAEEMEGFFPHGKPVPRYEDRPWPVGQRCKPDTPAKARRYIKSSPELIVFFYNRYVKEIYEKERQERARPGGLFGKWVRRFPHVYHSMYGACLLTTANGSRGRLNWNGFSNLIYLGQIAALRMLIQENAYSVAEALNPLKMGSHRCHIKACMAMDHLAWESKYLNDARGSHPDFCYGYHHVYDRQGRYLGTEEVCNHGKRPCIRVKIVIE